MFNIYADLLELTVLFAELNSTVSVGIGAKTVKDKVFDIKQTLKCLRVQIFMVHTVSCWCYPPTWNKIISLAIIKSIHLY